MEHQGNRALGPIRKGPRTGEIEEDLAYLQSRLADLRSSSRVPAKHTDFTLLEIRARLRELREELDQAYLGSPEEENRSERRALDSPT